MSSRSWDDEETNRFIRLSCLHEDRTQARDKCRRRTDRGRWACMTTTSSPDTTMYRQADESSDWARDTDKTEIAATGLSAVAYQGIEPNKVASHGRPSSEICRAASSSLDSQASARLSENSLEILDYYFLSLPPLSPLLSGWASDVDDGMTMHVDNQSYASDSVQKVLDEKGFGLCSHQPGLKSTIDQRKRTHDGLQKSLPQLPHEAEACCRRRARVYSLFPIVEAEHYSLDQSDTVNRLMSNSLNSRQSIMHQKYLERRQRSDSSRTRGILLKSHSKYDCAFLLDDRSKLQTSPPDVTTSHRETQQGGLGSQEPASVIALHTRSTEGPLTLRVSHMDESYTACRWSDESTLNQRSTIATAHNLHLSGDPSPNIRAKEQEMISSFEHDDNDSDAEVCSSIKHKFAWWRECSHKAGRSTSTLNAQGHQDFEIGENQSARVASTQGKKSIGEKLSRALLCGSRSSVT